MLNVAHMIEDQARFTNNPALIEECRIIGEKISVAIKPVIGSFAESEVVGAALAAKLAGRSLQSGVSRYFAGIALTAKGKARAADVIAAVATVA